MTGRADAGSSRLLDAVSAVVIGGASLYGGKGTIIGTVIGALIIIYFVIKSTVKRRELKSDLTDFIKR